MARQFQRGHKAKLSDLTAGTDLYVGVRIGGPTLTFDISCFGLDADEKLSDDRYFVFYNQPKSPEEAIQQLGAQAGDTESFRVTFDRVPQHVHRLSFTATLDGEGQMSQIGPGYLRIVAGGEEVARYTFDGSEFTTERAVMLGDFYVKDGWRFAAIGQGFDGGLAALLRHFGGEVAEEETPPAAPPAPAAPGFAPPADAPPAFAPPAFSPPGGQPPPPTAPHAPPPAPQPTHSAPTMAAPLSPPAAPPAPPQQPPGPYAPPPVPQQTAPPGYTQPPGAPFGAPHAPGAPPAPGGGPAYGVPQQGGSGLRVSLEKYREAPVGQRWTAQNHQLVRADLGTGQQPVLARQGSMVLYQGEVDFGYKGAGLVGRVVGNATGQEMRLMRCTGRGQVFFADQSSYLHPIELQGDAICVSAQNVLAFDESLSYEVRRIEGHGIPGGVMFTLRFQGTGTVVVTTRGTPVVLPVTPMTFADAQAVVAWSAAAQVIVSTQVRLRRHAYPGHSGESVNLQFRGAPGNFIVVQPYEV
ncbi:TerD family protein [Streptomyces sp. JJ66]|uniref:TerD family protein n=1 Tax=Streptomyces sp. JJ66 TaxID=2803843 RepID=UPI001C580489|nr:TerD family protein [Streptomyces sp. JJ66]MBW1602994.1 TerD family protein [Streptomyces sp. JJ66]